MRNPIRGRTRTLTFLAAVAAVAAVLGPAVPTAAAATTVCSVCPAPWSPAARFLSDLNGAAGGAHSSFIATQTTSLWNADRDSLDRFGERWPGQDSSTNPNVRDWRAEVSALEAFLA